MIQLWNTHLHGSSAIASARMLRRMDWPPNENRAGCNFSAISGTDENALKWDKLGYAHLAKLATQQPDESFVKRTPSTELWDEKVPKDKIRHMSDYLEDASQQPPADDGRY